MPDEELPYIINKKQKPRLVGSPKQIEIKKLTTTKFNLRNVDNIESKQIEELLHACNVIMSHQVYNNLNLFVNMIALSKYEDC